MINGYKPPWYDIFEMPDYLRSNKCEHYIIEEWLGSRKMFMNYAKYSSPTARRFGLRYALHYAKEGNMGYMVRWMINMYEYFFNDGVDIPVSSGQIDALYRHCLRKKLSSMWQAVGRIAINGDEDGTESVLRNSWVASNILGVDFDKQKADDFLETSYRNAIPKLLKRAEERIPSPDPSDYSLARWYVSKAKELSKKITVKLQTPDIIEHRLCFTDAKSTARQMHEADRRYFYSFHF